MSINLIIIIATVVVSFSAFNNGELSYKLAFSPYRVKHDKEWTRIVTHAFVHADHLHLFFNMYVLYNFGDYIETALKANYGTVNGGVYYAGLYLGGVIFATLPSLRKYSGTPSYYSVGASGAVSAVLFAFILLYPKVPLMLLFIPIPIPAYIFGILYLAFESYANQRGRSNIAHDAHIAGAVFGILYILAVDYRYFYNFIEQIF